MACHSAGIKVPNTVAIASLGGGVLSTVCSPALTTVEFPRHDIGVKAGKALLELLNDKPSVKSSLKFRQCSKSGPVPRHELNMGR